MTHYFPCFCFSPQIWLSAIGYRNHALLSLHFPILEQNKDWVDPNWLIEEEQRWGWHKVTPTHLLQKAPWPGTHSIPNDGVPRMPWHFPLDAESRTVQCVQHDMERRPHLAYFVFCQNKRGCVRSSMCSTLSTLIQDIRKGTYRWRANLKMIPQARHATISLIGQTCVSWLHPNSAIPSQPGTGKEISPGIALRPFCNF